MEGKNAVNIHILSLVNSLLMSGESYNGSILTIICDNLESNECNATQLEIIWKKLVLDK